MWAIRLFNIVKLTGLGYFVLIKWRKYIWPVPSVILLFIVAITGACRDYSRLKLPADTGLLVSIVIQADGKIDRVSIQDSAESTQSLVTNAKGSVVSWLIPTASLLASSGLPLHRDSLAKVSARLSSAPPPSGSCQRCVSPELDGKQILRPGDACHIPSSAMTRVHDSNPALTADMDALRKSIHLDFPGPCECEKPVPGKAEQVRYRPHTPDGDPWSYSAFAMSQDGSLGVFSENYSALIDSNGVSSGDLSDRLRFPGPVVDAAGIDQGFLVIAQMPLLLEEPHAMFFISSDATQFYRVWTNNKATRRIDTIYAGPLAGQVFVVSDNSRYETADLLDCRRLQNMTYQCTQSIGELLTEEIENPIRDLYISPNNDIAVLLSESHFSHGTVNGQNIDWKTRNIPWVLNIDEEPYTLSHAEKISSHANHWVLCGPLQRNSDNEKEYAVFVAEQTATPLSWEIIHLGGSKCFGSTLKRGDTSVLQVSLDYDQVWEFGADKSWTKASTTLSEHEGLDRPVVLLHQAHPLGTILWSGDQAISFRGTNSSSVAQKIYGPDTYIPYNFVSTIQYGEEILAIREDGVTARIRPGTEAVEYLFGCKLLDGEKIIDSYYSPHRKKIIAIAHGESSRIIQIDPTNMNLEKELYRDEEHSLTGITDTEGGHIFVTSSQGLVFRISDSKAIEINIDWDNPDTIAIEASPDLSRCLDNGQNLGSRVLFAIKPGIWQDLGEKQGVVWISGCDGFLLRISKQGAKFYPQINQLTPSLLQNFGGRKESPSALTAILPLCGDHLYAGATGVEQITDHRGRIWDIEAQEPSSPQTLIKNKMLAEFERLDAAEQHILKYSAGFPIELLGPPKYLRYVFNYRPSRKTLIGDLRDNRGYIYDDDTLCAAQIENQLVVLGMRYGRLLIGRPD